MKEEIKDEIISDAIEQYIKAERENIRLQRENLILWLALGIVISLLLMKYIGG